MRMMCVIGTAAAALTAVAGQAAAQVAGVRVLQSGNSSGAVTITGNGLVQAGPMSVNSSSTSAISGSGNGRLDCDSVNVVGNASFSGNFVCTSTVASNASLAADPCAAVSLPAPSADGARFSTSSTVTMSPGTYRSISITGRANVTMLPGTYIVKDGMSVSGQATITGQGVTLVMQGGALSLSGQTTMTLTPPTTGSLTGMSIAQPASNTNRMSLTGGSLLLISGTIYAPSAELQLSGNGDATGQGPLFGELVVVNKLKLSGNGVIRVGESQAPTQPPLTPMAITVVPPHVAEQFD